MNGSTHDHRQNGDRSVIDKVRKLLAKAERTDNAEEADAFSRKAAELVAAHRLDPRRLATEPADNLSTITINVGSGPYVRARLSLLNAVARANGCVMVSFTGGASGQRLGKVAGFASDVETTEAVYTSLHLQAAARIARIHRSSSGETRQFRRSFLLGYADGVRAMLVESQRAAEHRVVDQSMLPALRARDQQVDDYARLAFGRVRSVRGPIPSSFDGWDAGRTAAKHADLGRRRVGETPSLGPAA